MEYYGFFNGDHEYGQEEFNRYFDNIYDSGVSVDSNNNMTFGVSVNGNTVSVAKGFAIIKGFYFYNDGIKTYTETINNTYDRIDRIVLRLDIPNGKVTIGIKQGTTGSNPQPPILERNNLVWELSLAKINVNKDGTLSCIDERVNKNLCGAIRPKNVTEIGSIMEDAQNRFNKWFDGIKAPVRNNYIQSDTPKASEGDVWIQLL